MVDKITIKDDTLIEIHDWKCIGYGSWVGFNPLNETFENSIWHHINNDDVVAIPREIHRKYYAGRNVQKHRDLILAYYGNLENMLKNVLL